MIVNLVCVEKHSTIKTTEQFDIPLKNSKNGLLLITKIIFVLMLIIKPKIR